ncbi:MAG: nucleotide 5'-monophosphate nucleosidase PpnN [Pseudomonadaceae bacterium]|nr:nucleotide 5'-monophosphate nucleosidase PpnN [Pseudomonadaceae bacterium]
MTDFAKRNCQVSPSGTLEVLSQREIAVLIAASQDTSQSSLFELFRRCALAVMNTGNETDDAAAMFAKYHDFTIELAQRTRGLKLVIKNAPASAFVEGRMIEGIRQHLFSVLRDIVYIGTESLWDNGGSLDGEGITDAVFHILNHARVLDPNRRPNIVVCWGGHSISRPEYEYTKEVGYHLGLRGLDICTGCGPGAMKGPMKGAAIGHAKQRATSARYLGLTEPGIIAAEPPNPMVSDLVILPDIEKRLEAFVRLGHAIIVFPGGVGTAEEVLYLLGVLLHPKNADIYLPVVFSGPQSAAPYFEQLDKLITLVFGESARERYRIITDDPAGVARYLNKSIRKLRSHRRESGDAFYYNWLLHMPEEHQHPFEVSHESVSKLRLTRDLSPADLAVNLRRVFSAIVTGNVKANGVAMIKEHGPFEISGDPEIIEAVDAMLMSFVEQGRMKLPGSDYEPCFRVVSKSAQ